MQDLNLKSLFFENSNVDIKKDKAHNKSNNYICPLKMWNMVVRKTTGLTIANDVRPAYFKLCEIVNEYEFNGQLSNYPELFPTEQKNNGPKWENRLRIMILKIEEPTCT